MVLLTERLRKKRAKDQRGLCFYCHLRMHDDMTWEHLVARHHGGDNRISNLRIAHAKCNSLVGVHHVHIKFALAEVGEKFGSDAFFMLASKLKADANPHTRRSPAVRRPKRPPPRIQQENVEKLLSILPSEILLAA